METGETLAWVAIAVAVIGIGVALLGIAVARRSHKQNREDKHSDNVRAVKDGMTDQLVKINDLIILLSRTDYIRKRDKQKFRKRLYIIYNTIKDDYWMHGKKSEYYPEDEVFKNENYTRDMKVEISNIEAAIHRLRDISNS